MLKQLNQVLALFSQERTELSVLDAAALVHWPRSTTYRIMSQFEKARFLDRDEETGSYRLGIRLVHFTDTFRMVFFRIRLKLTAIILHPGSQSRVISATKTWMEIKKLPTRIVVLLAAVFQRFRMV